MQGHPSAGYPSHLYLHVSMSDTIPLGEKMLSWGGLSADGFIHEVSEFLVNNPYEEEGPADQHHKVINKFLHHCFFLLATPPFILWLYFSPTCDNTSGSGSVVARE